MTIRFGTVNTQYKHWSAAIPKWTLYCVLRLHSEYNYIIIRVINDQELMTTPGPISCHLGHLAQQSGFSVSQN